MPCSQRSAGEELQLHTVVGVRLRTPIILDFESGSLRYATPQKDTGSSIVRQASAVNICNVHTGVDAWLPRQYNVASTSARTGTIDRGCLDVKSKNKQLVMFFLSRREEGLCIQ